VPPARPGWPALDWPVQDWPVLDRPVLDRLVLAWVALGPPVTTRIWTWPAARRRRSRRPG
jgi:hypothetical protein